MTNSQPHPVTTDKLTCLPESERQQGSQPVRRPDNEIGVIIGKKGSGKTTLARYLCTQIKRKIILDTLGTDYGGGTIVQTPADLVAYHKRVAHYDEFSIIARPQSEEMPTAVFRLAKTTPNCWVIVEEADRYATPHQVHPDLLWLVNYARQQNTSIICICRRAARMSRDITANADWIVAHHTQEPRDVDYLNEFMDADSLPTLPAFTYEMWGHSRLNF